MPNKPNPENQMINFRLNRALKRKLDKLASVSGTSATAIITQWIVDGTQHIELSAEDYEEIAAAIREAKNK